MERNETRRVPARAAGFVADQGVRIVPMTDRLTAVAA
jgi:hypothetical protein